MAFSTLSCFFVVMNRNSHWSCSVRKAVFRNFAKLTGKRLCQSHFLNNVAGLRPQARSFIKIETLAHVFSCELCEIFKNTFFKKSTCGDCFKMHNLSRWITNQWTHVWFYDKLWEIIKCFFIRVDMGRTREKHG